MLKVLTLRYLQLFKKKMKIFNAKLICENRLNCRFAFLISYGKTGDQKKLRSICSSRK